MVRELPVAVLMLWMITVLAFLPSRCITQREIDEFVANRTYTTDPIEGKIYIRHLLGLDQPIYMQYLRWLGVIKQEDGQYRGLVQGSLGEPLWPDDPAN